MPVDSTHPQYDAARARWRRMRDALAGQDAVHSAGTLYLPRLRDQSDDDYLAYVQRATWFGATARTLDALHGALFRKPPTIVAPDAMADIVGDITMAGETCAELAAQCAREVLSVGRVGVLVDYPPVEVLPLNAAASAVMGLRPFAALYQAESIINWRAQRIANRLQLSMVALTETYETTTDGYDRTFATQVRVLRLEDGFYVQELWRTTESGRFELAARIEPRMRGQRMPFIPFVLFGALSQSADVSPPPLLNLADLNLSHYRSSADLEHGAHFTGLPMLFVAGVQLDEGAKVSLGSQTALVSPDPAARAEFVEFRGSGLGALESMLARKEAQMAALGASMLAPPRRQAEAAQTHEMRIGQETASLSDIARVVGEAMTRVLEYLRDWAGLSGDVSCEINTDFAATSMTAQELTALLAAWQAGAISRDTLFYNLQQGELVRQGKTLDDELSDIEAEGPSLGTMTDGDGQRTAA